MSRAMRTAAVGPSPLIESFAPRPDAVERHRISIPASREAVYRALWRADLGASWTLRALIFLRGLPRRLLISEKRETRSGPFTLEGLIEAGFGRLAERPGEELVLGIAGRFWRPADNVLPFRREDFEGSVPPGLARAVWSFSVHPGRGEATELATETRVVCGDAASRRKFRLYWLVVRPFSGLIRRIMLRAVKRECRSGIESA